MPENTLNQHDQSLKSMIKGLSPSEKFLENLQKAMDKVSEDAASDEVTAERRMKMIDHMVKTQERLVAATERRERLQQEIEADGEVSAEDAEDMLEDE